MRLSGLVMAAVLVHSTSLLAQHSSAGGGSSSGGSSHSGSSSASYSGSSHASSVVGAASSRVSGTASAPAERSGSGNPGSSPARSLNDSGRNGTNVGVRDPKFTSGTKPDAKPEKKGFASFVRHSFKKMKPVADFKRPPCRREPCAVCPPGAPRKGRGGCVASVTASVCQTGQFWNGFTCGTEAWFDDCRALREQLAEQQRQMRGQNDPGPSLRYQQLKGQYYRCMERLGVYPFGAYTFDIP